MCHQLCYCLCRYAFPVSFHAGILLNRQSPKPFSIQSPKNDLIGRRVILRNRGKQSCIWSEPTHREVCTIRDITVDGSMARIAFELDSGDVLEKMIRDSEVTSWNRREQ